jgi:hypothetical protein
LEINAESFQLDIPLGYPVPVSKKNGKISLFIDFIDLNRHAIRHHSPLPMTDGPQPSVNGSEVMSILYGFLYGYN